MPLNPASSAKPPDPSYFVSLHELDKWEESRPQPLDGVLKYEPRLSTNDASTNGQLLVRNLLTKWDIGKR